jgi:hypothetical protein
MSKLQELEQQIFDLDLRVDNLESPSNKVVTKEKINSIVSNGDKYQTNFIKTKYGNGIKSGDELLIKIRGAEVVTGKISHKGKLLMIDQSHAKDEDNDASTINFKLRKRSRLWRTVGLDRGTYELHLWFYDKDSGERGLYRDKFKIIA